MTAAGTQTESPDRSSVRGLLIINADDWGGWKSATDAAVECVAARRITSVSAMVFMDDSERAASISQTLRMDVGLHINLSQPFTDSRCSRTVADAQTAVCRFLTRGKFAQMLYNPGLRGAFLTAFRSQTDEFLKLYGRTPTHYDGHHHMHLCANMLLGNVIPEAQKVRRSFHFWPGEKSFLNRAYRSWVDSKLRKRQTTADYFFSLAQCLGKNRLLHVAALAQESTVEIMTHPEQSRERDFLLGGDFLKTFSGLRLGGYSDLGSAECSQGRQC